MNHFTVKTATTSGDHFLKWMQPLFIGTLLSTAASAAPVTISADFTEESNRRGTLHDMFSTLNRISPKNGVSVIDGYKVNTIRMIGGINKKVNGENVPDLDFDTCLYNTNNGTYTYNWTPLQNRIDAILNQGVQIDQIVLDQPPWAFQQGYTFIPEGQFDGVHFRENERVSSYGNSLPPCDKSAYYDYIRALTEMLTNNYGKATVESWQLRVGSEIETRDHWYGTEQDFIDHMSNTISAVRSVLPNAKLGIHTRKPDFELAWAKNYKGETVASFADGIIDHCHAHATSYDFWAISEYPRINDVNNRDVSQMYNRLFQPLVDDWKFDQKTPLSVHEFNVICSMEDNGTITCLTSHADTYKAAMATLFYSKGVDQVYQWGNGSGGEMVPAVEVLKSMVGNVRYNPVISGAPVNNDNEIYALVSKHAGSAFFELLLSNYKKTSLTYGAPEQIAISLNTQLPVGTELAYRKMALGKDQNKFQNFLEEELDPAWWLDNADHKGDPNKTMNEDGKAAWNAYQNSNPHDWTSWMYVTTVPRTDGGAGSVIQISTQLPSFAIEKIEILSKKQPDLLAGWDRWSADANIPATQVDGVSGNATNDGNWSPNARASSNDETFGALRTDVAQAEADITDLSGLRSNGSTERYIDFVINETEGSDVDLGGFHIDLVSRGGGSTGSWKLDVLVGGSITPGEVATGILEDNWDANYLADLDIDLQQLADARLESGGSATFRLSIYTESDSRSVDLDNVGITKMSQKYNLLSVNNGSGDGIYTNGTAVAISADDAPQGMAFDAWIGDIESVSDVNDPTTTLIMLSTDVQVTATYKISYTSTFTPTDDAYLQESTRYNNTTLRVQNGSRVSYLKFNVTGPGTTVEHAEMVLKESGDTGNGTLRFYKGSHTTWTEDNLSTANAPLTVSEVGSWTGSLGGGQTITVDVTPLLSGTGLYSVIIQMDSGGNDVSLSSKEGSFIPVLKVTFASPPVDTTPPAAPAGLAAVAGNGSVSLDWADNAEGDLAGYTIYRSVVPGNFGAPLAEGIAFSAYIDNTVVNGVEYFYTIKAIDTSDNTSTPGNEVSATPLGNGGGGSSLIVGWEQWTWQNNGPVSPATYTVDASGSATQDGTWAISTAASSTDGTFGSLASPAADATADDNGDGFSLGSGENGTIDFTIAATGPNTVLSAFHFDAAPQIRDGIGATNWTLEVLSGDITTGVVDSGILLAYVDSDLHDVDVDLTALADHDLGAGGTATFRLSFSGNEAGWGRPFKLDNVCISGGTLPAQGYAEWADAYGGTPTIGSETNDYDGDGVANLAEYALGGNPVYFANRGENPTFGYANGQLQYVHPQRSDTPDLVYTVETCTNLLSGAWTNGGYAVSGTNGTGGVLNYVTNAIPANHDQTYIRLNISKP